MLWSLLSSILTALIDSKDWKALQIKTNPAYAKENTWKTRTETKVTYKSRFRS